jgi:hypothetical protein
MFSLIFRIIAWDLPAQQRLGFLLKISTAKYFQVTSDLNAKIN